MSGGERVGPAGGDGVRPAGDDGEATDGAAGTGDDVRVVVAGWVGAGNLGDELVHAGVRRLLAEVGVNTGRVTAVSEDPDATTAAHGGSAVRAAAAPAAIRAADLLVWGGGGIVQDETSALNLPYHLSRPAAARATGTPWVGVGLGVGPLVGASVTPQLRLLRSAAGLTVRDAASARLLARHGVDGATVACDAAFALDPPEVAAEDVVVVALRPWEQQVTGAARLLPVSLRRRLRVALGPGRTTGAPGDLAAAIERVRAAEGDPDADEARLAHHAATVDAVAAATGLRVRLVAFEQPGDAVLHRAVADRATTPVELVEPGLADVLDEVARARLVVGMRFHAGVAATLAGRPLVALRYSPKVGALGEAIGAGGATLAWDAPPDEVAGAAAGLLADEDAAAAVVAAREAQRDLRDRHRALLSRGLEVAAARRTGPGRRR